MKMTSTDVRYENGCGKQHSFRVVWRESFGLVYISFYDEDQNDFMFEDELDRATAVILRDRLTLIIETTAAAVDAEGREKNLNSVS